MSPRPEAHLQATLQLSLQNQAQMQWTYASDVLTSLHAAHYSAEQARSLHCQCLWLQQKLLQKDRLLRERPLRYVRCARPHDPPASAGGIDPTLL